MSFNIALSPRRIARSLVTVLVLTLLQTIGAPILAPQITTANSEANTGSTTTATYTASSSTSRSFITIPAGVESVSVVVTGGGGGKGGNDGNAGAKGGMAGRVTASFAVTPGDVLSLFPGNAGVNGKDSAAKDTDGVGVGGQVAGGASTVTDSYWKINGPSYQNPGFSGGAGGKVGNSGTSGSGGGGGAASVLAINRTIVVIASGAGGGGGAGNTSGAGGTIGVDSNSPNSNLFAGGAGKNSGTAPSCTATDGGGGGGGGGGLQGGLGGDSVLVAGECSGRGGFRGSSFVEASISSAISSFDTSQTPASPLAGTITYSFHAKGVTACVPTTQVVDIYTVLKFDSMTDCTFSVPANVSTIDVFAVGAGGGGGGDGGSGGGGGAALSRSAVSVNPSSTLTVKVGVGGRGGIHNSWAAGSGESSTVVTSTGAVLYALGGAGGGARTGAGGAGGTAPNNGAFAGGAGGTFPNAIAMGGVGNFGISNYFYGSLNSYAGGGGGGCYFETGSNVSGAAGRNGGGAGCSNTTDGQVDGVSGSNGTGGGGGGGGAGAAGRVMGGKGGSGVVLIRYATVVADAFPAGLASSIAGRWTPNELQVLDSARRGWVDSSGTYETGTVTGSPIVTTTGTSETGTSTGSTKTNLSAAGDMGSRVTFVKSNIPTYTIFHIARYVTDGTQQRIVTASNNWLSGHYSSTRYKTAWHDNAWMTPQFSSDLKWLLSTDQVKMYRANGQDLSFQSDIAAISNSTAGPTGLGINTWSLEESNWQFLDLIAFNRKLSNGEIRGMESYLARIYGLTLDTKYQTSDTDTAATLGSPNLFFNSNMGEGNTINDTFTIAAWVKPATDCENSICQIASKESTFLFGIGSGILRWMLAGTSVGGASNWNSTTIRIEPNEWSHVAMVKQFTGDSNGSLLFYLNGQLAYIHTGTPYASSTNNNSTSNSFRVADLDNNQLYIGGRASIDERFYGEIDEVKIWKVARTASEILQDMHSNDATNLNLQMYYNFNVDALTNAVSTTPSIANLAQGGVSRSDLYSDYITSYATIESRTSVMPYTTITFPRTIITKNGGWKAPQSLTAVNYLIAAGGGAGGRGDSLSHEAGGGGAGGVLTGITAIVPNTFYPIVVGVGGVGIGANPTSGGNSSALSITTIGGGHGGFALGAGASGGSGGGGAHNRSAGGTGTPGQGFAGVTPSAVSSGGGGGGATASGVNGVGGFGLSSSISGSTVVYGDGGGSGFFFSSPVANGSQGGSGNGGTGSRSKEVAASNGKANTGSGGGGANSSSSAIKGGNGGSGVVIVRYITALRPTYTKPTNAFLNVGMTETFTTNVAVDSATVGLTRTFRWESTTPTSNGVFTTIKTGTGAANAVFSWVPTDTSTSGSGYLYRLTVTDSDTAGLFITDSSTAFATINRALVVTSSAASNSLAKRINIARNETFTITFGTPTYRATLSPVIPGITIDTSTAGSVILRIGDTLTVGTYLETLTVTDSVSASIVIPLTIVVAAPPQLANTSEIVKNGLLFDFDASSSASFNPATRNMSDISGARKTISVVNGSSYSSDHSGILSFNSGGATGQYATATSFGQMSKYTVETYIRLNGSSVTEHFCPLASEYTTSPATIGFALCIDAARTFYTGFFSSPHWTYKRSAYQIPFNTWTHLLGTFDGTAIRLYVNGVEITVLDASNGQSTNAGLTPPAPSTNKVHINRTYTSESTAATPGNASYGLIRLYNVGFTQSEVTANFSAVRDRFTNANLNQLTPSQKYGNLTQESFTATSGFDTKTVTFATGNRAGIKFDLGLAANRVDLAIQESLTVGTYNDTITVTDSLGQSTFLPIRMSVTKADTLTVSMESATVVSYNGAPIVLYPKPIIKGLKGFDTATSLTRFSSTLYTASTVVPTNADTYTVMGADLVFSIGALSNYEGVIYETTTAVVNKIRQRALDVFKYGGTVGSDYLISLQGGDGTGVVTQTLTGVSSLSGCAISGQILRAAEQKQGFCEVRVVKAGDQNYFAETETAQLFFMAFINNVTNGLVGSGSTIALNSVTTFETSTVQAPSITGLSTLTLSLGAGGTFTITGTGFTGSITIKFWRNKSISVTSSNGTTIDIPVSSIASSGATSGRIAVITAAGEGVSVNSLTITP